MGFTFAVCRFKSLPARLLRISKRFCSAVEESRSSNVHNQFELLEGAVCAWRSETVLSTRLPRGMPSVVVIPKWNFHEKIWYMRNILVVGLKPIFGSFTGALKEVNSLIQVDNLHFLTGDLNHFSKSTQISNIDRKGRLRHHQRQNWSAWIHWRRILLFHLALASIFGFLCKRSRSHSQMISHNWKRRWEEKEKIERGRETLFQ